ncbi:hypothetical protein ABE28_009505 [Peribacillus muralis]|uniref:Transporter n=1 Tax=Peribacillus muralis TaxID=264697 RepID=A0A1B3XMZ2_9BACI|nr:AEC family transporter [Peribacillus muralis]AOH54584.1 hypothetical protein ABE28_009505 [Peribacillus muralis]
MRIHTIVFLKKFSLKSGGQKQKKRPVFLRRILGLIFACARYNPPHIFVSLAKQLALLASPLAMFYIGMLIMSITKSQLLTAKRKIIIPTIIKLVSLPLVVFGIIKMMNLDRIISQTLLIQAMMPVLTIASILFSKYGANENWVQLQR